MEKTRDSSAANKPLTKFRAGTLAATVWENQNKNSKGEVISFKSVSFDRSYKDTNGEWQKTNSLRMSDLPKAALVLNKAYEFLALAGEAEE
jgi:hypothetical protein